MFYQIFYYLTLRRGNDDRSREEPATFSSAIVAGCRLRFSPPITDSAGANNLLHLSYFTPNVSTIGFSEKIVKVICIQRILNLDLFQTNAVKFVDWNGDGRNIAVLEMANPS